jgi:hypothetical protein
MPELMDFRCFVGTYEFKSEDELDLIPLEREHLRKYGSETDRIFLVQTGPAKPVRVTRKALEYFVGLLLKMDTSNSDADGIAKLKRNVSLISRSIGILGDEGAFVGLRESLSQWILAAKTIQGIFSTRDLHTRGVFSDRNPEEREVDSGYLKIFISYDSDRPSIRLHPNMPLSALLYCAAQMIARGITVHACDNCGTPFLGGGERSRNKKRARSRFCSDTCRYEYHNERRRKTARKSKS